MLKKFLARRASPAPTAALPAWPHAFTRDQISAATLAVLPAALPTAVLAELPGPSRFFFGLVRLTATALIPAAAALDTDIPSVIAYAKRIADGICSGPDNDLAFQVLAAASDPDPARLVAFAGVDQAALAPVMIHALTVLLSAVSNYTGLSQPEALEDVVAALTGRSA